MLGWSPQVPAREGVKKTVEYFAARITPRRGNGHSKTGRHATVVPGLLQAK